MSTHNYTTSGHDERLIAITSDDAGNRSADNDAREKIENMRDEKRDEKKLIKSSEKTIQCKCCAVVLLRHALCKCPIVMHT